MTPEITFVINIVYFILNKTFNSSGSGNEWHNESVLVDSRFG